MTTVTLPEGHRIAADNEAGWTYFGLWITDAPADENEQHDIPSADYEQRPHREGAFAALRIPSSVTKEIVYAGAGDYDCFVTIDGQREYIGSAPSYHDGELKCNNYAYHYYTDHHTPEVAAAIAVGMSESLTTALYLDGADAIVVHATAAKRDEYMRYNPSARIIDPPFEETGAPTEEERAKDESAPPAHRSVTVGYDGEQCDLVSIAAQALLPLKHLRPSIGRNGTYLLLMDTATIPPPVDDRAIVCDLIDRLNEVATQLPARPTSITAWMHVDGEIYQVARNKER